jgi:hypothetical protein
MNENVFVNDDDIEDIYGAPQQHATAQQVQQQQGSMGSLNGMPVYSLSLAQVPALSPAMGQVPGESLLTRRYGPLPVWGWALGALGVGVGGYFFWQNQQKSVSKNGSEGESRERELSSVDESPSATQGWSPSRSGFCEQIKKHFMRKGMSDSVEIFEDADTAKKKLKQVSPLINIKCSATYKPDADLVKICKREGLNPIVHEDKTIGLYPIAGAKRGKAWEEYIDLLRDDGQTV